MRIVVNHLTRMKPGYICVAGIDTDTKRHVRPVLPGSQQLSDKLLRSRGGPFDIGCIVEIAPATDAGSAPEFEDRIFDPAKTKSLGMMSGKDYWSLIDSVAQEKLETIFGPGLTQDGNGATVLQHKGIASLGVLRPTEVGEMWVKEFNKKLQLRIPAKDGRFSLDLSVTDLRLFAADWKTPNKELVAAINKRLKTERALLNVGLSRPFQRYAEDDFHHWLQVNNPNFPDATLWQFAG